MKYLLLINIFLAFWSKFNRITEMNSLKEKAAVYYQNKDFVKSIAFYENLLNVYKETDEHVVLDLANSYFQLKRYNSAIDSYKLLINSKDPALKSTAYLQLGVIYSSNNKKEIGLSYFKEALKASPENEEARYNFELLKKEHEHQQKDISPDKKKENSNGKNKTSSSTSEEARKTNNGGKNQNPSSSETNNEESSGDEENNNTGGEEEDELQYNTDGNKETDALASQRLEEMNMNERQARTILKTMKNAEIQYIQQRKKIIVSKLSPGRPDW
jgi:Ca-activated chloride channel family protein